jgi:hypothetical protein
MNTQPMTHAELAAVRRTEAREHALDHVRRAASALTAAMLDEPNSKRSQALHDLQDRLRSLIAELRLLA